MRACRSLLTHRFTRVASELPSLMMHPTAKLLHHHGDKTTFATLTVTNELLKAMGLPPTLLRAGRKLVSPSQHLWIRARDTFACNQSGEKTHLLEIGLTGRGVEDIGNVQSILLQQDSTVRQGQDLLRVLCEEGFTTLKSPVTGRIHETDISTPWIDADDYLLSMTATEKEVFSAFSKLVCEESYNKIVEKLPPGRFAQSSQQQANVA